MIYDSFGLRQNNHQEEHAPMVLARQDREHFIFATDDGEYVRIQWRHAQVRMVPSELLEMGDFLQESVPRLKTNTLLGNAFYCLIQDDQDNFEVWLLGVGFYMASGEFQRFMQLITDGADAVRMISDFMTTGDAENEILH